MLLGRVALTPNQSRIYFDLAISLIAAAFSWTTVYLLQGNIPTWHLVLSPFLIVFFNWVFGIYSRYRLGASSIKTVMLTASVICSTVAIILMGAETKSSFVWALFIWIPLFLPRLILNINTRVKTNFLKRALKNRGPVLVVGGGGYIGSHVVDQLLQSNYQVRVLDKLIYGRDSLKEFENNPKFELIEGDSTEVTKLVQAMDGVSAVVHMAGLVGDPACAVDENFTRHTNVISTRMVKEVALSFQVPRFIFASSCSVYGVSDEEVDETSDLSPVSLYARTKIDSEKELLLCPNDDFAVTILRFATVFGHSRRPRFDLVANLFTAQGMSDGKITVTGADQWRPFIHVKDLARAIVTVLKADADVVNGKIYNVGDSRLNMTIGQLAQSVKTVVEKERLVEVVELATNADRRNYAVSFKKIVIELNFKGSVLIEDGVKEMVEHFKKGTYSHYKESKYSNLAMTKIAVEDFYDPLQTTKLYRPVNDLVEGVK